MAYTATIRYRTQAAYSTVAPSAVVLDFEVVSATDFADIGLFLVQMVGTTPRFQRPCSPSDLALYDYLTADADGFKRVAAVSLTFPGVYVSSSGTDWCVSTVSSPLNTCQNVVQRTASAEDAINGFKTSINTLCREMTTLADLSSFTTTTIPA